MTETANTPQATDEDELRARILAAPDVILEDRDLMRALISAGERRRGGNVVDIRALAMERLEARLGRLEDTHRTVIAAAYDNLAGTRQIHRAVLCLLEPADFDGFLGLLENRLADALRVGRVRLVLESRHEGDTPTLDPLSNVLSVAEPGFVDDYLTRGRDVPARTVTLRQLHPDESGLYGKDAGWVRSEACLKLDLGPGRMPGMLALGSDDPQHFAPSQGTDLLVFFGAAFERALRRWLA